MKWTKILLLWSLLTACEPQQGKTPLEKKVVNVILNDSLPMKTPRNWQKPFIATRNGT